MPTCRLCPTLAIALVLAACATACAMGGDSAENIETAVDRLAAVIFAAAAAFAVWRLSPSATWALPGSAAVVAFLVVRAVLRRLHANRPQFRLPEFELASFEAVELPELLLTELPELVLTDQDRVPFVKAHKGEELLLDDILAEMGPGSRVVRLFDPSAMPTPDVAVRPASALLDSRLRST